MKCRLSIPWLTALAGSLVFISLANAALQQTAQTAQAVPSAAGVLGVQTADITVPAADRPVPPHLADAEKLLAELSNAMLNVYGEDKAKRPFTDWSH